MTNGKGKSVIIVPMPGKIEQVKTQSDAPLWLSALVIIVLLTAGVTLRLACMKGHYFVPMSGNYISLIAGLLAIIPIGWLAKRLGGSVAMWVAVGLYIFNAKFLPWMTSDTAEPIVTLFFSLAVLGSIVTLNKPGIIPALITGLLIGACWIFRVETFFFIPAYSIFFIIVLAVRKVPAVTIVKITGAVLVGWIIFAVPMMIFLFTAGGNWIPGPGSDSTFRTFASALEFRGDLVPPYDDGLSVSGPGVTGSFVENIFRVKKFGLWILKWWGIGLAFIGGLALLFSKDKRLILGVVGAAFVPLIIMAGFGVVERLLIPYTALAQVVAGVGIAWIAGFFLRGHKTWHRQTGAYLIIAGLILSGFAFHARHALMTAARPGDLPYEHRAMAYYIREHEPEIGRAGEKSVSSYLPWVKYYSEIENFKWMPVVNSIDELRDYTREENIGWLVIDTRSVYRHSPALSDLLNPRHSPDWLEPVVILPSRSPIILYERKFE